MTAGLRLAREPDQAALPDLDVMTVAAWASAVADDLTLGGLISACLSEDEVPEEVRYAVQHLRSVPLSQLVGSEVPPLAESISALVSSVSAPELAAREFSRSRPPWRQLGQQHHVSGEGVRKRVAKGALHIRGLLASDRFRAVRLAATR